MLPLAHPITQAYEFPVSPLVAALGTAALVLLAAFAWPERRAGAGRGERELASWAGSLSAPQVVTRVAAVALLALAIAAGRLGADDELENLAPALVVGAGWPLLVLASALVVPVWRWLDPWDSVARPLAPGRADGPSAHVWPAALVAVPWVWYLSAYTDPLRPRSVGALLALYTLVTIGGCLALGRRRWLSSSEPLGILLSWLPLLPRRRLTDWEPPRGAEALLGVLAGGVLFGAARRSELWGGLNTARGAAVFAAIGLVASCAAGCALLAWMASRSGWRGAPGAAARAAVPAVAAIVVAVALDRNRFFTSVQLLPGLAGDPFGRGWDLLGRAGAGLDPAPLGTRGLLWAQLGVVLAGHVAGAVVVARRLSRRAREPVAVGLALLAAVSVIALASH